MRVIDYSDSTKTATQRWLVIHRGAGSVGPFTSDQSLQRSNNSNLTTHALARSYPGQLPNGLGPTELVNVRTHLTRRDTASSSADKDHLMIISFTYLPNQRGRSPPRADSLPLRWGRGPRRMPRSRNPLTPPVGL